MDELCHKCPFLQGDSALVLHNAECRELSILSCVDLVLRNAEHRALSTWSCVTPRLPIWFCAPVFRYAKVSDPGFRWGLA